MTDYRIEFAPPAEQEVADAIAWYRSKNAVAADTFKTLVFDAVEMICHSPLSWPKISDCGVRKIVLPRYPYSMFFAVSGDTVTVLAFMHHRRAPREWN